MSPAWQAVASRVAGRYNLSRDEIRSVRATSRVDSAAMKRVAVLVLVTACSGTIAGTPSDDDTTAPDAAPAVDEAVARALQWVAAKVPYCQAPNHGADEPSVTVLADQGIHWRRAVEWQFAGD